MIVIVHGYEGSGPGHFQHWLADSLRAEGTPFAFPDLPSPTLPIVSEWVAALRALVEAEGGDDVTFVAHSLGCWAVDHYVQRHGAERLRGALLVAPPSPYSLFEPIQGFLPPPRDAARWAPIKSRVLVVGSDDDDYADEDEFVELATRLEVGHRIVPGAGHINAAAGFGPFPLALEWLREVGAR